MLVGIISLIRRKNARTDKYRREHYYKTSGSVVLLEDEIPRFFSASILLNQFSSGGRIVRVSCGAGIGPVQIRENVVFKAAGMESSKPIHTKYIVTDFNQVINCSKDSIRLLKRYVSSVEEITLLSIGRFETKKWVQIWKAIGCRTNELASLDVVQQEKSWNYKAVTS